MDNEHPASMTARAMKQALPDRAIVTRDARVMMNTATSMFTLYLSTIAHDISTNNKRSTITLKDVLSALRETDFEHFIEPVEQCLHDTKAADARKGARKEAQKTGVAADDAAGDGDAAMQDDTTVAERNEEEIPIETDADLDGEHTIDEDEDIDGDEDEEMENHGGASGVEVAEREGPDEQIDGDKALTEESKDNANTP